MSENRSSVLTSQVDQIESAFRSIREVEMPKVLAGNKAACTRMRKLLLEIKSLCHEARQTVSSIASSGKGE